ncbi:hypothetical protein DEAC_c00280 [Desulfosporosinus acididurans]|uniref:Uncharacterized protein n=1 Tax=Desulfosporosinus acididurans TaxID=476652 RepID=A0A0J1FW35_9FIRM|nr:hypothetical protein DEAC_c00280 [Desulfosporosinus acididurans]
MMGNSKLFHEIIVGRGYTKYMEDKYVDSR